MSERITFVLEDEDTIKRLALEAQLQRRNKNNAAYFVFLRGLYTAPTRPRSNSSTTMPHLGDYRDRAGFSRSQVARMAGVSERTVLRAEQGKHIHPQTLRKLSIALHLDSDL